jgi:hypothetical protein
VEFRRRSKKRRREKTQYYKQLNWLTRKAVCAHQPITQVLLHFLRVNAQMRNLDKQKTAQGLKTLAARRPHLDNDMKLKLILILTGLIFVLSSYTKMTQPAEVRRSNIDLKLLSKANKRAIPLLTKDTIYSKINFSPNSKITKSSFANILKVYNDNLKKLKDEGFYKKGVNGIFINGSNGNDTLFFEYNHINVIDNNIKCVLRVQILFDATGQLKPDEDLRIFDIRVMIEKQKPQFNKTEKDAIIKALEDFGDVPDAPPPTNNKK